MKKHLVIIALLLLILPILTQASIYEKINEIRSNPSEYTIVVSNTIDNAEIKSASELASFFGITKSNFDTEIIDFKNLVVIGAQKRNKVSLTLLRDTLPHPNPQINQVDSNIILLTKNTDETKKLIDIIKNYENYKDELQTNEYLVIELFSPELTTSFIIPFIIILLIIAAVITIVLQLIKIIKKNKVSETTVSTRIMQQISPQEQKLIDYIQSNLQKGYTKEQIKQVLLKSNWNPEILENVFSKF